MSTTNKSAKKGGKPSLGHDYQAGPSRLFTVKMPEDLRADIERAADLQGKTLSEFTRDVLRRETRRILKPFA